MDPRKTHFEQIPVGRVKEIAKPLLDNNTNNEESDGVRVPHPRNGGPSAEGGWRTMAQQIQKETDTDRLIELVQQLIANFDEQERRTSPVQGETERIEKRPSSAGRD